MMSSNDLELVRPSKKYKNSYLVARNRLERDFIIFKEDPSTTGSRELAKENFDNFLKRLEDDEKGTNLKKGRVPQSAFWAVVAGGYVGRISLRHRLTEKLRKNGGHIGYAVVPWERRKGYGTRMLKLILPTVADLGIDRVLVTCDEDNVGSRKIIETNGGVLEDVIDQGQGKPKKLRFWIDLTKD